MSDTWPNVGILYPRACRAKDQCTKVRRTAPAGTREYFIQLVLACVKQRLKKRKGQRD